MRLSVFFDHILQAREQTGADLENLLQGVKKAKIEAVEINLDYLVNHKDVLDMLKKNGLAVSCIYEFYEMGQKKEAEKARLHIETARKAGAGRILVVPGFLVGEASKEMQEKMADREAIESFMSQNAQIVGMAEGLSYIAKLGETEGVVVTVEDFDDLNSPLSGMYGIGWFLKQIPQLRYTLDTGNYLYNGEQVLNAFNLHKEKIVHVHCKDREPGTNASVESGKGYIPFAEIIHRLKEQNYNGYLAIEHFDVADQEGCMKRSACFLKRMCETERI